MKFFIFGIGRYYLEHRDKMMNLLDLEDEIVGFIDNRTTKMDHFDGRNLYPLNSIVNMVFDKIIIMSIDYLEEMKMQLRRLGIDDEKICYFGKFISEKMRGKMQFYKTKKHYSPKKRILIITETLGYHGGAIAASYAARCLRLKGYNVCLAAQSGDIGFIKELTENGATVVLMSALPYIGIEEMYFIELYDVVVINTFPMIFVAKMINKCRPVLWWIHEGSSTYTNIYRNVRKQFSECNTTEWMKNVNILAVSDIAKRNFESFYPATVKGLMPYGIPDHYDGINAVDCKKHIVFAIIGYIYPLKGQNIFLQAVNRMREERKNAIFLIIGQMGTDDTYKKELKKISEQLPEVQWKGPLNRNEMHAVFPNIDVVVSASLEDSLPIVVTEAMMYGKVCIITDNVGQAALIDDEKNGLICKSGNVDSLCEKMRWVMTHKNLLHQMGEEARRTYEQHFTMTHFGDVLERNVLMTEDLWN